MENSYQPAPDYQPPGHRNGYDHHEPKAASPYSSPKKRAGRAGARGVEYIFLTIALLTAASSLMVVLINWIDGSFLNGQSDFYTISFPASALIISLPVFALLLMDVRRAESRQAGLRSNPYKKWSALFVRIVAFTTCFFTLIGMVYGIFTHAGGESEGSLSILFVNTAVILVVAGGILAYYMKGASAED